MQILPPQQVILEMWGMCLLLWTLQIFWNRGEQTANRLGERVSEVRIKVKFTFISKMLEVSTFAWINFYSFVFWTSMQRQQNGKTVVSMTTRQRRMWIFGVRNKWGTVTNLLRWFGRMKAKEEDEGEVIPGDKVVCAIRSIPPPHVLLQQEGQKWQSQI